MFPETAPGSFTWDDELGGWVWTTFNTFQWDVDWSNPDVFAEYAEVVLELANLGVEVLRLDAIAFLWKRLGTSCQNQPEVHALTQALRAVARLACPAVAFKAEAIVGPADLVHYLGAGRPPRQGERPRVPQQPHGAGLVGPRRARRDARRARPAQPAAGADDGGLGDVRPLPRRHRLGRGRPRRRRGRPRRARAPRRSCPTGTPASSPAPPPQGLVFQENPATGDRRISGTAANLVGLTAARASGRRGHAVDLAVARLLLAHAVAMGWGGVPVLWSGDELGAARRPGLGRRPRARRRQPLGAPAAARRGGRAPADRAAATVEGRVFGGLAHLAATRAGLPHLHASVPAEVLELSDPGVLPVLRRHPVGPMVGLYNVTEQWRSWPGAPAGRARAGRRRRRADGGAAARRGRRPRCGWRRTPPVWAVEPDARPQKRATR